MPTLNNYTISDAVFPVVEGSNIYNTQQTATLVISPNQGYTVNSANFSSPGPLPSFLESYEFVQDGDNVNLVLTILDGATMPSSNIIGEFCITGSAQPKLYGSKFGINYQSQGQAEWDYAELSNYVFGAYGTTVLFATNTVNALPGGVLGDTNIIFDFPENAVTYEETKTYDINGNWTSSQFDIFYTFPNYNFVVDSSFPGYTAPHYIEVTASARLSDYVALEEVTAYTVSTNSVPSLGGEIIINVYGNPGAIFSIEQTSQGGGIFIAEDFELTSNYQSFVYALPEVAINTARTFQISGDLSSSFNTTNGQSTEFEVYQNLPVSITFDAYGTDKTGWSPVVRAYNAYSAPIDGSYNSFANIVWEITGSTAQDLSIIREIELDDWENLATVTATVTSDCINSTNIELDDTTGIIREMILSIGTFSNVSVDTVVDSNNIIVTSPVTYYTDTDLTFSAANNNGVTIDSSMEVSNDLKTITITADVDITQFGSESITFILDLDNVIEDYVPTACLQFYATAGLSGGSVIYRDCSGDVQSFALAPNEISSTYSHLDGTIEASADVVISIV